MDRDEIRQEVRRIVDIVYSTHLRDKDIRGPGYFSEDFGVTPQDVQEILRRVEDKFCVIGLTGKNVNAVVEEVYDALQRGVKERVLRILCEQLMWDPDEIREKLKKRDLDIVEDLGADDEDLLQLAWEYEMEFEIKISDEEARRATQFSQIVKLIQQKLSG